MTQNKKTGKEHNLGLAIIFITILMDITGYGIILPILPKLIETLIGQDVGKAAQYGGIFMSIFSLMQFAFAPLIGSLSDKYGRRPVILISLLFLSLSYLEMALAPTFIFLLLGRAFSGITGSSISAASAYVADVSTDENRTKNFGLIGAALGMGFALGPFIGGYLGAFHLKYPFYAAFALCLINFFMAYIKLPESLNISQRKDFNWKRANFISIFLDFRKQKKIHIYLIVFFLLHTGLQSIYTNWGFYTYKKFNWNERAIGISLGFVGFLLFFVQGGLVRWLQRRTSNEKSLYAGLFLYASGMILLSLAPNENLLILSLIPFCLGAICESSLTSIITSNISPKEQGRLQGLLTTIRSLCIVVGANVMSNLFYYSTNKLNHPSASFQAGALLLLATIGLLYFFNVKKTKN